MNRKKKINQTLIAKDKKKKAKLHGSNKPKYVSKAERERLAQAEPERLLPAAQCGESSPDTDTETQAPQPHPLVQA